MPAFCCTLIVKEEVGGPVEFPPPLVPVMLLEHWLDVSSSSSFLSLLRGIEGLGQLGGVAPSDGA